MSKPSSCLSIKQAVRDGNIEDVIAMSPSGQVVIPQKIRTKAGFEAGDKLMMILENTGGVKYLYFVKANKLYLLAEPILKIFLEKIEGVVEVDNRGQIVIPQKTRVRAGIKDGGKILFVTQDCGDKVCCVSLVRSEDLPKLVA